jgi:hypothetical protein
MKNSHLALTIIAVIVVFVVVFSQKKKETPSPEQERVNSYVPDPCEYQIVMVDDSLVISDFGRHVTTIHINSSGKLGEELIKDNE